MNLQMEAGEFFDQCNFRMGGQLPALNAFGEQPDADLFAGLDLELSGEDFGGSEGGGGLASTAVEAVLLQFSPLSYSNSLKEQSAPKVIAQITWWLYQQGHSICFKDSLKEVAKASLESAFRQTFNSYEEAVEYYALVRFGLVAEAGCLAAYEEKWSDEFFQKIANPHRILAAEELPYLMGDGFEGLYPDFSLIPGHTKQIAECLKRGIRLEDANLYATSVQAETDYYELALNGRYSKDLYFGAFKEGNGHAIAASLLNGESDALTMLLCGHRDFAYIRDFMEAQKIPTNTIREYRKSYYLKEIVHALAYGDFSEAKREAAREIFNTQNAVGDYYATDLAGQADFLSGRGDFWNQLLFWEMKKNGYRDSRSALSPEAVKNLLTMVCTNRLSYKNLREYCALFGMNFQIVDATFNSVFATGKGMVVNALLAMVVIRDVEQLSGRGGKPCNTGLFVATPYFGSTVVVQAEGVRKKETLLGYLEHRDEFLNRFSDLIARHEMAVVDTVDDFGIAVRFMDKAKPIQVLPGKRRWSSLNAWAGTAEPFQEMAAYNRKLMNAKLSALGWGSVPDDFGFNSEEDAQLGLLLRYEVMYGIFVFFNYRKLLQSLESSDDSGHPVSEAWFRLVLISIKETGIRYQMKKITKQTLNFDIRQCKITVVLRRTIVLDPANFLYSLQGLLVQLVERNLPIEIVRHGDNNLLIQLI